MKKLFQIILILISFVSISMANPLYSSVPLPTNPAFYEAHMTEELWVMAQKFDMQFADNLVVVDLMPASNIYSQLAAQTSDLENLDETRWNLNKEQRMINFSHLANINQRSNNKDTEAVITKPKVEENEIYWTNSLFLSNYPWGWGYGYGLKWSTIPFRPIL